MKLKSFLMSFSVVMMIAFAVPALAFDMDTPQMEQSIQMEMDAAVMLAVQTPSGFNYEVDTRSVQYMQIESPSLISLQLYADLEDEEPGRKRNITLPDKSVKCGPILHVVPG